MSDSKTHRILPAIANTRSLLMHDARIPPTMADVCDTVARRAKLDVNALGIPPPPSPPSPPSPLFAAPAPPISGVDVDRSGVDQEEGEEEVGEVGEGFMGSSEEGEGA